MLLGVFEKSTWQVALLVNRLVKEECYPLAAYVAKTWQLPDTGHIYEAWALALIGWGPSSSLASL